MKASEHTNRLKEFHTYRDRMNERILEEGDHLGIKRFFNLDSEPTVMGRWTPGQRSFLEW